MEFESAQSNTTAKLPILKLGVYEMWVIRIKQYFQVQDYALWEVIDNGNSWVFVPQTAQENGTSVTKMLQKIVSRLAILGVVITQEDLNSKFLRSVLPEWNTHVVVWMNKKSVGASSGAQNLAFMTAPSTSRTNDVNTANPAYEVSTVSLNINTACPHVSTANFSDNTVYAFMVENPNGSNLQQQDLDKIHKDDLEVMDLKWQLSLLKCFNCHKMRHFVRECKAPKNKEGQFRYQDNTRKQRNNEDTSSKSMLAIDGVDFDWGDMAKEQVQTNMALMAFSDSEAHCKYHQRERMVYGNNYNRVNYNYTTNRTHPNAQRNMVPIAVLMKTGLKPFNTARTVNTAHPKSTVFSAKPMSHFSKTAQSTAQAVNTTRPKAVNTARPHSAVVNAVRVNQANAGNIAYLSNFKEFDGGYVTFRGGAHCGRIFGTQGELNVGTSIQKEEISQDCIMMPIWKDASYFDSPSKDVGNGDPKSVADDQKHVEDGPDNENDEKDKSEDDSSPKEVNTAGQHVNTASPEVNIGRFKLNTVDPLVHTTSSSDLDSPKDMFTMGASNTIEATHVEFFNDEDEPEVDLGNILNSYTVPTTPNIRIHKYHTIKNVIGDVKSYVQTRRMTKPTSEQEVLSVVYKEKTHDTLNT
ncbi:ribonuclease H-like domain-containing protein, partial [Tanacetum coccineum]